MKLTPHVETLRTGLANAASLGDDTTQDIARRLGGALDNSARLALIGAISEATGEISTELAPGSVELRMSGDEPQFAVHVPQGAETPTVLSPPEPAESSSPEPEQAGSEGTAESTEDEPQVRVSLRLPASVKSRVDEAADSERISTNAWLVRAIQNALAPSRSTSSASSTDTDPPGGWFGPQGPFGPDGPFGPNGVFGDNGPFAKNPHRRKGNNRESTPNAHMKGSNVKGWVQ